MGLNTEGGSRTYLKISEGRIAKKVEQGTAGAVEYTSKEGKVSYELRFPSVTGRITHIEKRVGTYGTDLQITLNDGQEEFLLQMPWSSKYSSGFFLTMPNINFNRQVTFSPWMKVVNDVKKTALYLTNEGEKENCKWFWTKESPGDCPQMEQITFKGALQWDDSKRQAYFYKYLNEKVIPKLGSAPQVSTIIANDNPDDSDSLPF